MKLSEAEGAPAWMRVVDGVVWVLRCLWVGMMLSVALTLTIRLGMANDRSVTLAEDPVELWIGAGVLLLLCDAIMRGGRS